MKHDAKSKASRVDLSITELEMLIALVRAGREATHYPQFAIMDLLSGLDAALRDQKAIKDKQRSAAADRRAKSARISDKWDRSMLIEAHQVHAVRGDYVDAGTVDFASWRDLSFMEAMGTTPVQADIRRDVWCVQVFTTPEERVERDRIMLGIDVTATADPSEVEPLARAIIERGR